MTGVFPLVRTTVVVVAGAAAILPFAAGYLLPQRGFLLIGLAALAGYSLPAMAVVTVGAVALRAWAAAAVLAVLLAAVAVVLGPSYVADGAGRGTRLVVMSANLHFGQADAQALVATVRDRHVEVLALEELTPWAVARLRAAGLEQLLPYSDDRAAVGAAGTGLWSSRPLGAVTPWPGTFASAAGDIDVDGQRLRVRALHPPPPTRGQVGTWERDYDGFTAAARRETTGPTLLLGDFNASVHHRRLRQLMGGRWRDAAALAGAGLVRTWGPSLDGPQVIDPDHVLVDRGMSVARFATVTVPRSDHRALVATVVLATRP